MSKGNGYLNSKSYTCGLLGCQTNVAVNIYMCCMYVFNVRAWQPHTPCYSGGCRDRPDITYKACNFENGCAMEGCQVNASHGQNELARQSPLSEQSFHFEPKLLADLAGSLEASNWSETANNPGTPIGDHTVAPSVAIMCIQHCHMMLVGPVLHTTQASRTVCIGLSYVSHTNVCIICALESVKLEAC